MATPKYFGYTPLSKEGNIRLMALDPESVDGIIRCRLEEHSLNSVPGLPIYEALSYEWGKPPDHDAPIYVNSSPHLVRKNLHHALSHLSNKTKTRWLWIDAICINQADLPERNSQVQLMSQIYSKARDVLVWLGLPERDGVIAMPYLKDISRLNRLRHTRARDFGPQKAHLEQLEAVATLCNRPYWQRIWVVQEIQFAKHVVVHCGTHSLSWSELARACISIVNAVGIRHLDSVKSIRSSLARKLLLSEGLEQKPLRDWLTACAESLCTDSRDRIYALLGLSNDMKNLLSPDYSKTLSQVCKDVIQAHTRGGVAIDDIVQFSEFLQSILCKPTETIRLPAEAQEMLWIRATRCGIISELDQSSYDFTSSTKVLGPKNIISWAPARSRKDEALQEESIIVSSECQFRIISHETELRNQELVLATQATNYQIEALSAQSRRLTGISSKDGGTPVPARDFVAGDGRGRVIGAAPTHASLGDIVFSSRNSTVAIVLRKVETEWQIVGRANLFRIQKVGIQGEQDKSLEEIGESSLILERGRDVYIQLTYALLQRLTSE